MLYNLFSLVNQVEVKEMWMWTGFIWLRLGTGGGFFVVHDNKTSSFIKGGELDWLSNCSFLRTGFAP
jgi:hypothetical protein